MRKIIFAVVLGLSLSFSTAQADQYVKLSTASQEVYAGPFVDDTDFKTAETALSIANTDVKLLKAGSTAEANKNSGGCTHIASGRYYCVLDATDTNTLGSMRLSIKMSGALEVWEDVQVLSASAYDDMFGATVKAVNVTQFGGTNLTATGGRPEVNTSHWGGTAVASATVNANMAQVSGDSTAADNFEAVLDLIVGQAGSYAPYGIKASGTAQAYTAGTPSVTLASGETFGDNTLTGNTVWIRGSTQGYWQEASIASNVGSTDVATLSAALQVAATGTVTYIIWGVPPSTGGSGLDAAGVRAAVGLASANLDTQLGAIDDYVDTEVGAIKTKTDFLPSATAGASGGVFIAGTNAATTITTALTTTFTGNLSGNVTGSVGSVTGNVGGTVNGLTSTAQGNVRTALGMSSANLDTQISGLSSAVAVIDAIVDQLLIGVNVEQINGVTVLGSGTDASPWNGE